MIRENFMSDLRLEVSLKLGGKSIDVPNHNFELRFMAGDSRSTVYVCSYIDGVWTNCEPSDDGRKLVCHLDNHGLGIGRLKALFVDLSPDSRMPDGRYRKVVPQNLGIELIAGAGDDAAGITAEIAIDIQSAISAAESAADDAEAAAVLAANAAIEANNAAEAANAAAEGIDTALSAKQDKLVSGTNIKTINGQSLLGSGDIDVREVFVVILRQNGSGYYVADKSDDQIFAAFTANKIIIATLEGVVDDNAQFQLLSILEDDSIYFYSVNEGYLITLRHEWGDANYIRETASIADLRSLGDVLLVSFYESSPKTYSVTWSFADINEAYQNGKVLLATYRKDNVTEYYKGTYDQTHNCFIYTSVNWVNRAMFIVRIDNSVQRIIRENNKHIPTGILHHKLMPLGAQSGEVYTSRIWLPLSQYGVGVVTKERICLVLDTNYGNEVDLSQYINNWEDVVATPEEEENRWLYWDYHGSAEMSCYVNVDDNECVWHQGFDNSFRGSYYRVVMLRFDPNNVPAIKFDKKRNIIPVYDAVDIPLSNIELNNSYAVRNELRFYFAFFPVPQRKLFKITWYNHATYYRVSILVKGKRHQKKKGSSQFARRSKKTYLHFVPVSMGGLVLCSKKFRKNSGSYIRIIKAERVNSKGKRASKPYYYIIEINFLGNITRIRRIEWRSYN